MSFEAAAAELEGAIASDAGETPLPVPTPVEQTPVTPTTPEGQNTPTPVQPTQPRDPLGRFATPEQPVQPDTFDGGKFNPDTLAPELQDGWKQLQAAFTQKTQELAAQRAQFDGLGDPETARQAVELYNALQDPQYLTQFHAELTQALRAQGLTPVQASAEAARQIEEVAQPQAPSTPDVARLREEYPELAPFLDQQAALQQRLDTFERSAQERLEAEQLAYTQMAIAGELQRQEMAIRQANPQYQQQDIDAVYELSSFYDGNLLQAQQRYEQIVTSRLEAYLAGKQSVVDTPGLSPVLGSGALSDQPVAPKTTDEGLKAALEYMAQAGIDTIA